MSRAAKMTRTMPSDRESLPAISGPGKHKSQENSLETSGDVRGWNQSSCGLITHIWHRFRFIVKLKIIISLKQSFIS